jgi:hypothetical protein
MEDEQSAALGSSTSSSLPERLTAALDQEWRGLARQVISVRGGTYCSRMNVTLRDAADREPEAPTAPVYRLWAADNFASDGDYSNAVTAYDDCVQATQSARPLVERQDLVTGALLHKARAAYLSGDARGAIATYRDLLRHNPAIHVAALDAGMIAERRGDRDTAHEFYERIASTAPSARTDDAAQLAMRAMQRLADPNVSYSPSATALADQLTTALERRDVPTLRRLICSTHFAVGPAGGHAGFEPLELLDVFFSELWAGNVRARRAILGSGGKRYLPSAGWQGAWFRGEVSMIISEAPGGWQWTGIALSNATERWRERWEPSVPQSNQPLPFSLHAPWPKGRCFTAGGLWEHVAEAAIVAAAWPASALVAAGFAAANCCGWGPRGYYYNSGPTHTEEDAFAIDFTRYRRYVPYDAESGGTPVLVVREGLVSKVRAQWSSGDPSMDNRVEVEHADPGNPTDVARFTSKYLHLEGPYKIPVSELMPIRLGTHLGFMDDTGTSVLNHLHFSIHDRQLTHPGAPEGRSVRPSPMSGVTLGDADSNTCVKSTNVDYRGENQLIFPDSFAGQNWLITPAATSVGEAKPGSAADQTWLLILSGVVNINLEGNSTQWLRETAVIRPDLTPALSHAIMRHNVPTPAGDHRLRFQVEQWAPHAAPSSMFNRAHSVNSGFAVDVWRPHPFDTDTDVVTNATINNIFNGIQVDLAVSDTDAILYRVSYHISLLGKIRFSHPIIVE